MDKSASAADVRLYVASVINASRSQIDARLSSIVPNMRLQTVSHCFTRNIDVEMFPIIMLEQLGTSSRWHAMPSLVRREFRLNIWGFVHWDDDAVTDDLVSELAMGIEEALVAPNRPTLIEGGNVYVYYDDTTPITGIDFGSGQFGNAVVKGFSANFNCHILQDATDPRNVPADNSPDLTPPTTGFDSGFDPLAFF